MTQRFYWRTVMTATGLCLVLMVLAGYWQTQSSLAREPRPASTSARTPVLVELFTSEGCSSCPPADRLLIDLEKSQPVPGAQIIALGQHVDYWNELGWKDVFSSAEISQRQNEYAGALHSGVYTPQMVVDGQYEFVGSDAADAREAIAKGAQAPKAQVEIFIPAPAAGTQLSVTVKVSALPELRPGDSSELFLAIAETSLASQVTRGENSGRQLTHTAVARRMLRLGAVPPKQPGDFSTKTTVDLAPGWHRENLRLVAFVQERESRRILGAAERRLE